MNYATNTPYEENILFLPVGLGLLLLSCNKNEFSQYKTQFQSGGSLLRWKISRPLLDNDIVMQETPELGELSSVNYYLLSGYWQGLAPKEQDAYVWAKDIYGGQGQVEDWDDPYQQVFYVNTVLEGLQKIPVDSSNVLQWKILQGSAYFIRAYAFYNLAQVFAPVYDPMTLSDPAIPLRFSSAINQMSVRASGT